MFYVRLGEPTRRTPNIFHVLLHEESKNNNNNNNWNYYSSPHSIIKERSKLISRRKKMKETGKRHSAFLPWPYFKPSRGWTLTTTFLTFPCLAWPSLVAAALCPSVSLSPLLFFFFSLLTLYFTLILLCFLSPLLLFKFSLTKRQRKFSCPSYFGGVFPLVSTSLFPTHTICIIYYNPLLLSFCLLLP